MSIEILKSLVKQMEKERDYIFDNINSEMEMKALSFFNGRAIGLSDAIHLANIEIEKENKQQELLETNICPYCEKEAVDNGYVCDKSGQKFHIDCVQKYRKALSDIGCSMD